MPYHYGLEKPSSNNAVSARRPLLICLEHLSSCAAWITCAQCSDIVLLASKRYLIRSASHSPDSATNTDIFLLFSSRTRTDFREFCASCSMKWNCRVRCCATYRRLHPRCHCTLVHPNRSVLSRALSEMLSCAGATPATSGCHWRLKSTRRWFGRRFSAVRNCTRLKGVWTREHGGPYSTGRYGTQYVIPTSRGSAPFGSQQVPDF